MSPDSMPNRICFDAPKILLGCEEFLNFSCPIFRIKISLGEFLDILCCAILDVRPQVRHFWDDIGVSPEEQQTDPKTKGTTVVQFLLFSNITIHTLDLLGTVYINIFVCREFDAQEAVDFCAEFFSAKIEKVSIVERV